ncbi:MAG TPA: hypothetical protein VFS00_07385, partial [Polyangiaceae bacterium]|nr:hypothetical protein [Polyangiaceae bacterium]
AAALAALVASAFAGCTQRPTQAPLRSLDRSGRVALFCAGDPRFVDEFGNMGRLMGECGNSFYDDASDFLRDFDGDGNPSNAPHVYAVVTQQTRGEAAVIDLSVDPGLTLSILDADLATPGLNFLPVGALPADVAASSYGTGAFVASAEPGRPGIYALPTTELRGPEPSRRGYDPANPDEGGAGPTATLRSWPACRLPATPGRMLLVQSGLPYQARNPDDPGQPPDPNKATAHLCPGPNRLREAPVEQPNLYAGDAPSVNVTYPGDARVACTAAEPYRCKPALAPPVRLAPELGGQLVTQLAEKLLVTLPDRGELLVIDAQTLFERPAGSFDPCPIERALPLQVALPEVPPFEPEAGPTCPALPGAAPSVACPARPQRAVAYPTEFKARPSAMAFDAERGLLYIADEGAPVIHELELGDGCDLRERQPLLPSSIDQPGRPVYTTALAVSPPTRDERTFLYAVDKERGSVMAFDVSNASLTRSPLERDRTDLNPFGSRDRLALDGPVRDVSFARLQVAVAGDQGNTSTPACSPDTTVVSPGDVYRTRTTDYADGAQPARLRGVFAFATLTTGVVQVVDVDD